MQGSWCCSRLEEYCHICGRFLPIQLDLPTPWLKWRIKQAKKGSVVMTACTTEQEGRFLEISHELTLLVNIDS